MIIELLVTICMRAYVCVCVLKTKYSLVKYEEKKKRKLLNDVHVT